VCGTGGLATTANGAGIEIKELPPGKFRNLRDPKGLDLFKILNGVQGSLRPRGMKKEVEMRSQYVEMFRIKNIDAKSEYYREVQPPKGPKKGVAIFLQPHVHKKV
jgi:hypothetical protein